MYLHILNLSDYFVTTLKRDPHRKFCHEKFVFTPHIKTNPMALNYDKPLPAQKK